MTITLSYEEHVAKSGVTIFVERVQVKISLPYFTPPLWRYGIILNGHAYEHRSGLRIKPNVKRLIEMY